jgi:hypothetical protein
MKRNLIYGIIISFLLSYTALTAEEGIPDKINIGIVSRINHDDNTAVILTGSGDFTAGQTLFADIDGVTITLKILTTGKTEITCEIQENDIHLLSEGVEIYSIKAVKENSIAEKNRDDKTAIAENDDEAPVRYRKWRPEPMVFTGFTYDTNNFRRGSDFYGKKSSTAEAYINILINSMYIHAGYENPGLNFFDSNPENYQAVNLSGSYTENTGLAVTPFFKFDYKYLPEAEKIDRSGFMTGTLGVSYSMETIRLRLSYGRDYYTDNPDNDRETFKDYIVTLNLSIYDYNFILSNIHLALNLTGEYYNNRFEDSKATPEDESRKGISSIAGQLYLNIHFSGGGSFFTEYNYAYMPDSDWSRKVQKRDWFGMGIQIKI